MLDVRRLVLLREIEARGSIAAVSRSLRISSSAISQQLAKLEADVGMRLLEQSGRTVHLTDAGRRLAEQTGRVVALLEQAEADIDRRRGVVQGVVRVVAFSTFALRYLADLVQGVAASHPDVVLEFVHGDTEAALEAVAGRRADIALIDEYEHIPRQVDVATTRVHLLREEIGVWSPIPVAAFGDMGDLPWIFEPAGADAALWTTRMCRLAGFEPHVRFESPDLRVHQSLAVAGLAAAFLPEMLFETPAVDVQRPAHAVPWHGPELHRDIFAVMRRGGQNRPAVAAVLGHLEDITAEGRPAPEAEQSGDRPPG